MVAPTEIISTENTIEVQWVALEGLQTGDSDILSYNLYWDDGSDTLDIELCDEMRTQFVVTGLVGGQIYKFKVRARNIYGYGLFSPEFELEASDMPGKLDEPLVQLDGTNVLVSWNEPSTHNAVIDGYQILFKKLDTTYVEYQLRCDGVNDAQIIST